MSKWSLKRPGKMETQLPPPTKFDRLSDEDLYIAVEQGIANAIAEMGNWHSVASDDRLAHLALTERHLETALGAVRSAMRRHKLRVEQ
jgi:hypothetical protein